MKNEIRITAGIKMRWEKGAQYYEAHLYQDLFGYWVLTRVWGKRGTHRGRVIHAACSSYNSGKKQLAAVQEQQKRRGYMLVLEFAK
jgi:hypothetical protein